jgi:hypothetical protein
VNNLIKAGFKLYRLRTLGASSTRSTGAKGFDRKVEGIAAIPSEHSQSNVISGLQGATLA